MRRRSLLTCVVLIALAMSGCAGAKPAAKYRIAVIPKGLTHEFWQSIHRGAQRAADDLKAQGIPVELIWDGPRTESDAQAQIEIVKRNVANKVHGIVLAPQHSGTMVAPVEEAVQQGIPVVIIDSGLDRPDLIVKYIATNNFNGGRLAGQHLLKVLEDQKIEAPKIILLRYAPGSESTEQRERGFEKVINDAIESRKAGGKPAITWLSNDQYAGATADSAQRVAGPLLNGLRDQGIDGIFCVNESSAMGMLQALRSLGLNKKVHLMGFDASVPLLQAVEEGDIDGLILQDPYRMGYLGVWTMVRHLEGDDVTPKGEKEQSTGEYVITKDNLNAASTRELFDESAQANRKIETPKYGKK